MLDAQLKMNVIKDVALLKLVGMRPIIVHGGGKEISKWVKLSGKEPEFYNGLRVTDKETMNIAEMVLNKVNKELVGLMQKMGVNAVGLCGKDGNMIRVNKKSQMEKIWICRRSASVNTDLLNTLMDNDFIPVIAPIGLDDEFNAYNTTQMMLPVVLQRQWMQKSLYSLQISKEYLLTLLTKRH